MSISVKVCQHFMCDIWLCLFLFIKSYFCGASKYDKFAHLHNMTPTQLSRASSVLSNGACNNLVYLNFSFGFKHIFIFHLDNSPLGYTKSLWAFLVSKLWFTLSLFPPFAAALSIMTPGTGNTCTCIRSPDEI